MRRLFRSVPLIWWTAAVLLAAVTGGLTSRSLRTADAARLQWGNTVAVAVVVEPVTAGDEVPAEAVQLRTVPSRLVPAGAATGDATGRVALVDLVPGEVLIESRLSGAGRRGVAAMLQPGEQGLAILAPVGERPPLEIGDRVDVIGVPADGGRAAVLTRAVRVVDVEMEAGTVTVAVPQADTVRLAEAVERGRVFLALVG